MIPGWRPLAWLWESQPVPLPKEVPVEKQPLEVPESSVAEEEPSQWPEEWCILECRCGR